MAEIPEHPELSDIESRYNTDHRLTIEAKITSARKINQIIADLIDVRSVIDVGCGFAPFLSVWREMGVKRMVGLDGPWIDQSQLLIPAKDFLCHDLGAPLPPVGGPADLVMCLEVAEHLKESRADGLVKDLTALAPVVAFSAAIPGQGGNGHINEQWADYWISKFHARGFGKLDPFRLSLWEDPSVCWWYIQNTYLFVHNDLLKSDETLGALYRQSRDTPNTFVHPRCFLR